MGNIFSLKRKLAKRIIQAGIGLPKIKRSDTIFVKYRKSQTNAPETKALDLGCGQKQRNPFNAVKVYGVDVFEDSAQGIRKADLAIEAIPFPEGHFDFVTAYDFLEHVPRVIYLPERRLPFIELMNEIYRVLKPGGIFFSCTPVFPFPIAHQDPTHVNVITEETFSLYFDDKNRWGEMYGFIGKFNVMEQYINGQHLLCVLKKP